MIYPSLVTKRSKTCWRSTPGLPHSFQSLRHYRCVTSELDFIRSAAALALELAVSDRANKPAVEALSNAKEQRTQKYGGLVNGTMKRLAMRSISLHPTRATHRSRFRSPAERIGSSWPKIYCTRDLALLSLLFDEECPTCASHSVALYMSLPFVHANRCCYRLKVLVRPSDWPSEIIEAASENSQKPPQFTWSQFGCVATKC